MITGPGWAATTRTSTPKSCSFFSIRRLVISSVSGDTVPGGRRAVEQVHLRQLAVGQFGEQRLLPFLGHALAGTSTSTGSIITGAG